MSLLRFAALHSQSPLAPMSSEAAVTMDDGFGLQEIEDGEVATHSPQASGRAAAASAVQVSEATLTPIQSDSPLAA